VTHRDRILKFAGCYHGHVDSLLASAGSGVATLGIPSTPGVPETVVADTIVCPYNDMDAVAAAVMRYGEGLACVIVEPVAGNMGVVPPEPGFLELLRALYDVRPPTDAARLAAFNGDAAKGMAQSVLVAHDVAKRKLQAADKTVRDRLDRFIAQRYPQGGRDQFVQALGSYGVSENDVLGEFRRLAKAATGTNPLSEREREVLQLVARGHTYRQIGEQLFISEKTVENHVRNILGKLQLSRRQELVRYALEHGLE